MAALYLLKTPRKKKAEYEMNDKRIPQTERDSELENATLPQQIKKKKERKKEKNRDLHP